MLSDGNVLDGPGVIPDAWRIAWLGGNWGQNERD